MTDHLPSVVLYADPSCPFAWITSRWLLEVAAARPLALEFRLMSLSVVNEGRELEPWYREFNDLAWGPARVAAAVQEQHGPDGFAAFYTEYGDRKHAGGQTDRAAITVAALAAAALPAGLATAAEHTDHDAGLRSTHNHVRAVVGEDLGTPVVVVDDAAFFGPVCASIPRGAAALALFDAVQAAAQCPSFAELKRGRSARLAFG